MQKSLYAIISEYLKNARRRRGWGQIVRVLACVVIFCTTYALILPAITAEVQTMDADYNYEQAYSELTDEEKLEVDEVVAFIDTIPTDEEITAHMDELEAAGDLAAVDAYFLEVSDLVNEAYSRYKALEAHQKAAVSNRAKLMTLEYIWGEQASASSYVTKITGYNLDANNILEVDGYLGSDAGYASDGVNGGKYSGNTSKILARCNVIFLNLPKYDGVNRCNVGNFLLGSSWQSLIDKKGSDGNYTKQGLFSINLNDEWAAIRVEPHDEYPFYIAKQIIVNDSDKERIGRLSHVDDAGYVVLVRKSYIDSESRYMPNKSTTDFAMVHMNKETLWTKTDRRDFNEDSGWLPSSWNTADLGPFAYMTLSPVSPTYTAAARTDDMDVVSDIKFKLFDYSNYINKRSVTNNDTTDLTVHSSYRELAKYFYFRGGIDSHADRDYNLDVSKYTPNVNTVKQDGSGHSVYDQDGFTANHARVESKLYNGYPILDFTVDANGNPTTPPSGWGKGERVNPRSLRYLFDEDYANSTWASSSIHAVAPGAVTEYSPTNTILQFNEDNYTYWYDSAKHAVDYDIDNQLFRVRKYTERTSITADWLFADSYGTGDFLPFNYSGGVVTATYHPGEELAQYHIMDSSFRMNDVNYWFGMTMEFTFLQGEDGTITYTNSSGETKTDIMKFEFSGDDDVWVFIDDVKILDLGGTHGSVTGSINFQTGEVVQKLDWGTEASSFPTTLKKCFKAAGVDPNNGWDDDGTGTPANRFQDYTLHTLKFFYIERGTAVANCSIKFNLPNYDSPLMVGKTLDAGNDDYDEAELEYLRENTEFSFRALVCDSDGNPTDELLFKEGQEYTLTQGGLELGTQQVGPNGIFKLKHGQYAIFENVLAIAGYNDTKFVIEEMIPYAQNDHYTEIAVKRNNSQNVADKDSTVESYIGYLSPELSVAEPTQVHYRNVVDTSTMSKLKVTKQTTEGSEFDADEVFTMQIRLDGIYLPIGTKYVIDGEDGVEYDVGEFGSIQLKAGQTATVLLPVLAGTTYEVVERVADDSTWVVTYTGSVTGVDGELPAPDLTDDEPDLFPLDGEVHVTITNSTYKYRVPFSFTKKKSGSTEKATFYFTISEWDISTNKVKTTPSTGVQFRPEEKFALTIANGKSSGSQKIYFVFGTDAQPGDYYFRIYESAKTGWARSPTYYIIQINLSATGAEVVGVRKGSGEITDPYTPVFTNYRISSLTLKKQVVGSTAGQQQDYTFKIVFAKGTNSLTVETRDISAVKTLADGTTETLATFKGGTGTTITLKHNESVTFSNLPTGAKWTITETASDGYLTAWEITEGTTPSTGDTTVSTDTLQPDGNTVVYTNTTTYVLPDTGGAGTNLYTTAGLILILISAAVVMYKILPRRREVA